MRLKTEVTLTRRQCVVETMQISAQGTEGAGGAALAVQGDDHELSSLDDDDDADLAEALNIEF
jgi:hypothetical protein